MLGCIRECVGVCGAYRDGVFARTVAVIVDLVHGVRGLEHMHVCMCAWIVHGCDVCTALIAERTATSPTTTSTPMTSWMMPAIRSSTLACGRVRVSVSVGLGLVWIKFGLAQGL